jgi:hypothetical protein
MLNQIELCYDGLHTCLAQAIGISTTQLVISMSLVSLWVLVWKGFSLWFSGRKEQKVWFVFLLITNTAGILPIIYLLIYKPWKKLTKKSKKK